MERHFLEKISWVACIVSAVIALIVWIKPINSDTAPLEKKQEVIVPAPTISRDVDKRLETPEQLAIVQKNQVKWSCEGVARDLAPAYETARKISYTDPRDKAFLSLSRKALCLENYEMFDKAANQISYTEPKDEAYGDAVDFTLNLRKFDLAEKYARKISYTDPRDAALARIVKKSSER